MSLQEQVKFWQRHEQASITDSCWPQDPARTVLNVTESLFWLLMGVAESGRKALQVKVNAGSPEFRDWLWNPGPCQEYLLCHFQNSRFLSAQVSLLLCIGVEFRSFWKAEGFLSKERKMGKTIPGRIPISGTTVALSVPRQ